MRGNEHAEGCFHSSRKGNWRLVYDSLERKNFLVVSGRQLFHAVGSVDKDVHVVSSRSCRKNAFPWDSERDGRNVS